MGNREAVSSDLCDLGGRRLTGQSSWRAAIVIDGDGIECGRRLSVTV